jgi:ABC-type oligopeptide transport system substrate-binding subunit
MCRRRRCASTRSAPAQFKFVEFKPNEGIKLTRNPDYWKPGRPYLDGIEYTIIPNRSTAILGFIAGKFDMTFPTEVTVPLMKDIAGQAPQAVCDLVTNNNSTNLLLNRDKPPFDNADIRKAMMLALDRKAFIDILGEGKGDVGGAMQPPPEGIWGLPPDQLATLPGYGPDVDKSRAEARAIMEKLGYGADKRLAIKVSTRNIPVYRDAAVILIDQLKTVYIDGEPDPVETATWFPKIGRKDYQVGLNITGSAVDDPDQQFYENYACGSERNYTGYCNKELDQLFDRQSAEADQAKRKKAGLGNRQKTSARRRAADHHAQPLRNLLAAPGQGCDPDGQQHLQRLADGRCLARQIAPTKARKASPGRERLSAGRGFLSWLDAGVGPASRQRPARAPTRCRRPAPCLWSPGPSAAR